MDFKYLWETTRRVYLGNPSFNIPEKMKKEITLGQLLTAGISVLIAVFSAWVSISKQVAIQNEKNIQQDNAIYEMKLDATKKFDKIDNKLDDIIQALAEKENRKWS